MAPPRPCPKCNRLCNPCGVVSVAGEPLDLPIYQCDECLIVDPRFPLELALIFAVGAAGVPFDPALPPGEPPPWVSK